MGSTTATQAEDGRQQRLAALKRSEGETARSLEPIHTLLASELQDLERRLSEFHESAALERFMSTLTASLLGPVTAKGVPKWVSSAVRSTLESLSWNVGKNRPNALPWTPPEPETVVAALCLLMQQLSPPPTVEVVAPVAEFAPRSVAPTPQVSCLRHDAAEFVMPGPAVGHETYYEEEFPESDFDVFLLQSGQHAGQEEDDEFARGMEDWMNEHSSPR